MYCQREVNDRSSGRRKEYCCHCKSVFRYLSDDSINFITWEDITLGGQRFYVKVYPNRTNEKDEPVQLFLVYHLGPAAVEDRVENRSWTEILRLDFIPDWTPTTAIDKLRILLPFL